MKKPAIETAELIYEADIKLTGLVEYGIGLDSINSGEKPIPPAGARFDHTFQGILRGPKLRGLTDGIEYLFIRPDGTYQSHLHGKITTVDGVNISLWSERISLQPIKIQELLVRTTITLFTLSNAYQWLNRLQVWAVGSLKKNLGEAKIRAYSV